MIPETTAHCQSPAHSINEPANPIPWQAEMQQMVTDPAELLQLLDLPLDLLPAALRSHQLFPLKVPRPFIARMRPGDKDDPLLRQVLPLDDESLRVEGFTDDSLQEKAVNPQPGLLHKYNNRVLLITTGSCAINCRFCFRRSFPYEENNPGRLGWQRSLTYIAADPSIQEVILSGGDPLTASDSLLTWFLEQLSAIPHVQIVRFHTRLPIVIPQRVTTGLIRLLTQTRLTPVIVLHSNHAQEIDDSVAEAASRLKQAGITLLNQSVLLNGVNDDKDTLIDLHYRLFACGILPYYLHQVDRVSGTAHFEVPDTTALALHQDLMHNLPGYLVPRLVREQPGSPSKEWLLR